MTVMCVICMIIIFISNYFQKWVLVCLGRIVYLNTPFYKYIWRVQVLSIFDFVFVRARVSLSGTSA